MSKQTDLVVKGGFGGGFEADAGQYISIIDLDGQQAGDFVALNRHDLSEGLSAVRTRRHALSLYFRVGDQLLSSRDHPMLEVGDGRTGVVDPPSNAGDRVVFHALMDVVCALSPCPQDIIPGNGLAVSDIRVIVSDTAPRE